MPMNPRLLRPTSGAGSAPCAHPASLLLHFDGNLTDSSVNGLTATAYGGATISTAQSRFGGASLLVGGGADRLTIPDSALLTIDGDFTVEAWVRPTQFTPGFEANYFVSQANNLADNSNRSWALFVYENIVGFYYTTNGVTDIVHRFPATVAAGNWCHVAASIRDGVLSMFVDGVLAGTVAISLPVFDSSADLCIGTFGKYAENNYPELSFSGHIDDLRITKGLAVYTGPFTPPTAPLAACVTPVPVSRPASLLLHFDGDFTDSSVNGLTVTQVGGATISTAEKKFGSGSAAFDGDGDYLTVPAGAALEFGTGDWTVEFWTRVNSKQNSTFVGQLTAITGGNFYFNFGLLYEFGALRLFYGDGSVPGISIGLTDAITLDVWSHVALVRSSGTITVYIDGVSVGSQSAAGTMDGGLPVAIGGLPGGVYPLDGYIDELRITKGLAVYTGPFTPPTAPLAAVATPQPVNASLVLNFDGNFTDESVNGLTVSAFGDAAISTSVKKFGGGAAQFSAWPSYATVATSSAFGFGAGDFTIEAWVWPEDIGVINNTVADVGGYQNGVLFRLGGSSGDAGYVAGSAINWNPSNDLVPAEQWTHVAMVRSAGHLRVFVNGVEEYGAAHAANVGSSNSLMIGQSQHSAESEAYGPMDAFSGYIDGLRITKAALYCSNFTLPTAPPTPTAATPCGGCGGAAPSCDPYGTYLRSECQGFNYGDVFADGECGEYFEVTSPGGCD